jgi:hypothetical protein
VRRRSPRTATKIGGGGQTLIAIAPEIAELKMRGRGVSMAARRTNRKRLNSADHPSFLAEK